MQENTLTFGNCAVYFKFPVEFIRPVFCRMSTLPARKSQLRPQQGAMSVLGAEFLQALPLFVAVSAISAPFAMWFKPTTRRRVLLECVLEDPACFEFFVLLCLELQSSMPLFCFEQTIQSISSVVILSQMCIASKSEFFQASLC